MSPDTNPNEQEVRVAIISYFNNGKVPDVPSDSPTTPTDWKPNIPAQWWGPSSTPPKRLDPDDE